VRLGISYPEITVMQLQAIFEVAAECMLKKIKVAPEIMIPVTMTATELEHQKKYVTEIHQQVCEKYGLKKIPYHFGTMIETPRAALCADSLAASTDFFSFGTNDLTQMTMGLSRDDMAGFLPVYLKNKLLSKDPFVCLEEEGVGSLIATAIKLGKKTNRKLMLGICGEHAGDAESIRFFNALRLDYVSCSPYRVPIARLAAAQAVLMGR
jgi:pyruvate,orthophosphate dikinase